MYSEVLSQLFEPAHLRVAALINKTIQKENFSVQHTAFFAANLLVDSEALKFTIEPWSPDVIPHQSVYDNPLFGNESPEDMERYRARGYGRLVGRQHYAQFSRWLGVDCVSDPDAVCNVDISYASWLWLWHKRHGRSIVDAGTKFCESVNQFIGWPDRIEQRKAAYERNLNFLQG